MRSLGFEDPNRPASKPTPPRVADHEREGLDMATADRYGVDPSADADRQNPKYIFL